jgi:AcrR family transcriptional regulator
MGAMPAQSTQDDLCREVRRARLIRGAIGAIDELGLERTTVTDIADAAGIRRGSFYGAFSDRAECLSAILELLTETVEDQLAELPSRPLEGNELVQAGVEETARILDVDQPLARVSIIELASGAPTLRAARAEVLARIAKAISREIYQDPEPPAPKRRALEAAVAGVLWMAEVELAARRPLLAISGEMTALLLATADIPPVIRQPATARARHRASRTKPIASASQTRPRLTARTLTVLQHLAGEPGASNAALASSCGNVDPGQMSKLLGRLQRHGLIDNDRDPQRKWAMNAWSLTPRGAAFLGRGPAPMRSVQPGERNGADTAAAFVPFSSLTSISTK